MSFGLAQSLGAWWAINLDMIRLMLNGIVRGRGFV